MSALSFAPEYRPGEARYLGRCRKCKTPKSAMLSGTFMDKPWSDRYGNRRVLEYFYPSEDVAAEHGLRVVNGAVYGSCKCGARMEITRVDGTYNPDVKCNSRCTSAVGPSCDCQCGGANHGCDHG